MGLIPEETIREIRDQADIGAIVSKYVSLKPAGRNLKGLCPFHQEKTPSFSVNPLRGFFYCFGCQSKGDVFNFLMLIEGKSFYEAVRGLAEQYSIALPETSSHELSKQRSRREALLAANAAAQNYFRKGMSEDPNPAMSYLLERGITQESMTRFGLGYAPDGWRGLSDFLGKTGVPQKDAIDVGLLVQKEGSNSVYDRYRARVVCPISTPAGDVVGFSARALSDDVKGAKYINSPESEVYKKSDLLYGLPQAVDSIRRDKSLVLVEGNFDVVVLHQYGIRNVVAPLGTALTEKQIKKIKRLCERVILCYDGDGAGIKATHKAIAMCLDADLHCLVAKLPEGKDPDSAVRESPESFKKLIANAPTAIDYLIHEVWMRRVSTGSDKAKQLEQAAAYLVKLPNTTRRAVALESLARAFDVSVNTVRAAARGQNRQQSQQVNRNPRNTAPPSPPRYELELVALMHDHPKLCETAKAENLGQWITDERLKPLYEAIILGNPVVSAVTNELPSASINKIISGTFLDVEKPEESLKKIVNAIRNNTIRTKLKTLQLEANDARRVGDSERERALFREIINLRKQVGQHGN